jgi:hypothetical protein
VQIRRFLLLFLSTLTLNLSACGDELASGNPSGAPDASLVPSPAGPSRTACVGQESDPEPKVERELRRPLGACRLAFASPEGKLRRILSFHYDTVGRLQKEVVDDDLDGLANVTTRYEYDVEGRTMTESVLLGQSETIESVKTYEYDSGGKRTVTRFVDADSKFRVLSSYDGCGGRTIDAYYRDGAEAPHLRNLYSYDENGRVSEKVFETFGTVDGRSKYRWSPNGRLERIESDVAGRPFNAIAFEYDGGGRVVRRVVTRTQADGGPASNGFQAYEYGSDGRRTVLRIVASDGRVTEVGTYEYACER